MWHRHRAALERGIQPVVPAGVLGQVWRGGPQARLARLLAGCEVEVLDEPLTRAAGVACARSGTADVIDATVVLGAIRRGGAIVTSDPKDLQRIAAAMHATVPLIAP